MSRFIDEAMTIESFLNNSEFDRMTLPKVIGGIIAALPELTYEQSRAIVEAIKLPRSPKLTDKEFLAYKRKMKEQGEGFPSMDDLVLSDKEIEELELFLEKRAEEKGIAACEPDFDKPIGVTADGYMIYERKKKGGRRAF